MMAHTSAKQNTREKCRPLLKIKANTLFPLLYISNIQSWWKIWPHFFSFPTAVGLMDLLSEVSLYPEGVVNVSMQIIQSCKIKGKGCMQHKIHIFYTVHFFVCYEKCNHTSSGGFSMVSTYFFTTCSGSVTPETNTLQLCKVKNTRFRAKNIHSYVQSREK